MKTWLFCVATAAAFVLGGCGNLTPCESELNCVIACECPNGAFATAGPYACSLGYCREGHAEARDCVDVCARAIPTFVDDDDAADDDDSGDDDDAVDDDDSGGDDDADDDDSAGAR